MKCKIIAAALTLGALALVRCLPPTPTPSLTLAATLTRTRTGP